MLRQTLLADAEKVLRQYRESMTPAVTPASFAISQTARPDIPQPRTAPAPTQLPLLTRARTFLAHHLAEPPALLDTLVLWALHTHAHARFDVSPRLILHGRDAAADHTRALRVLRWLVPAPRLVARATAAHVLDLLAHESATLLLDDAANATLARRDMRALIAAGAHADGALLQRRTRSSPPTLRRCTAPLAIATGAGADDDVLAHAIVLPMAPALAPAGRAREPLNSAPDGALALREEFAALGTALLLANKAPTPALPPFLANAAAETWSPLFACAEALGGEAVAAARAAASQFANPEHLEPPTSARALLRDIRRIVGIDGEHVPSKSLVEALTRDADSAWSACDWGAKLTPRGLAKRLAKFDVRPQVIHREAGPSFRGYKAEALLVAFARYLNDPVARAVLHQYGEGYN
jgi:hypothetical protein